MAKHDVIRTDKIICLECRHEIGELVVKCCEVCRDLLCPLDESIQRSQAHTVCADCNYDSALTFAEALNRDLANMQRNSK